MLYKTKCTDAQVLQVLNYTYRVGLNHFPVFPSSKMFIEKQTGSVISKLSSVLIGSR